MRLSIVVPTYNRPELLGRCADALIAQDLDVRAFEIIIADDAASEITHAQVEAIAAAAPVHVHYVPVTGRHGPAAARNAGWRSAHGEVIAFTDDDTIPESNWASTGLGALERDRTIAAATGRTEVPLPQRPTDYEHNESGLATAEFITANCFIRRSVLETVHGFDERFRAAWREDSDLHFALLERDLKIIKVPTATVVHPVRPAPWGISLRQQRKNQYDALLYKKYPVLYRRKIVPGRPWDYYLIVASLLVGAVGLAIASASLVLVASLAWLALTGRFVLRRLRGCTLAPAHVAEMFVTSALIPPLSLYWRFYGAVKFRAWFV